MNDFAFGGNAYYAAGAPQTGRRSSQNSDQEAMFLRLLDADTKQRVERAYRQRNMSVREQVRNETGLRLTGPASSTAVPVRVSDGLPEPFASVVRTVDDEVVWWIAL